MQIEQTGMMMFSKQTYQKETLLFWGAPFCFQMPEVVKFAAVHRNDFLLPSKPEKTLHHQGPQAEPRLRDASN